MNSKFLGTQYIDLYLNRIFPPARGMNLCINSYDINSHSKSLRLQYHAVLAAAARFLGQKDLYPCFEKRATQLASELIDDFTLDTAVGFFLFAYHLWGENDLRACHYRDITSSLLKRINNLSSVDETCLFLVEFGVTAIVEFDKLPHTSAALDDLVCNFKGKVKHLSFFYEVIAMKALINKELKLYLLKIFGCSLDNITLNRVTQEQFLEVDYHLKKVRDFCASEPLLGAERNYCGAVHLNTHYAILHHSVGNFNEAIGYVQKAIEPMEDPKFQGFCSANFISSTHVLFIIAFRERKYTLANRVTGIQRRLAMKLPAARELFEKEMELMRGVDLSLEDPYDLIPSLDNPTNLSILPMSNCSLEISNSSKTFSDADFSQESVSCEFQSQPLEFPNFNPQIHSQWDPVNSDGLIQNSFLYPDNEADSFIASLLE